MSVANFAELREHVGHEIECVTYGTWLGGRERVEQNVALECVDCSLVLVDFDAEEETDGAGRTE